MALDSGGGGGGKPLGTVASSSGATLFLFCMIIMSFSITSIYGYIWWC